MESNLTINLTPSAVTYFVVIALLLLFAFLVNRKVKKASVERVDGIFFGTMELLMETCENFVEAFVGKVKAKKFVPLFITLFGIIFIGDALSIIGFTEIAIDLSIPFMLTAIMFIYWNYLAIKENGVGNFLLGFFKPIPIFFPMEILSFFSKALSLMVRLFGNILSGYIIVLLLWTVSELILQSASDAIGSILLADASSVVIAIVIGVLQLYFALFSSFIQATVFTSLTLANIATAYEEE